MTIWSALLVAMTAGAPDFDTDVLPVLTKAGCNAAACHGAAAGRGGFHLSLFGGNPGEDHDEIVHRLEGRRINRANADRSLLLLKPTEQVEHEGGRRFDFESVEADVLREWIRHGATRTSTRRLLRLELSQTNVEIEHIPADFRVSVKAVIEETGSGVSETQDVTTRCVYIPEDSAAVEADGRGGLKILRSGRHVVAVRYLSQVRLLRITVPVGSSLGVLDDASRRNWIDDEVLKVLTDLRLSPAAEASDAALLRRVTLDLTGRLPPPENLRRYLSDTGADKYERTVHELLQSPEYVEFWTYRLARLLRVRTQPNDERGTQAFYTWLREQVAAGTAWNDVAQQMLTATGDSHTSGPPNFYRATGDARSQAEYVSEALMGVRLRCANCHDHPLDQWTQDDYHGLAAIFARVAQARVVGPLPRGEVTHPRTGQAALPRIPGSRWLEDSADHRGEFARWLTSSENPYFAKAMVNRLWKSMLGRGLVEPADDLRVSNSASHPELLDRLTADFVEHGYDIRQTLRLIATSATYRRGHSTIPAADRTSTPDEQTAGPLGVKYYQRAAFRPLDAEVLVDAMSDVMGRSERPQPRAIAAVDSRQPNESLELLGRCSREDSCDTVDTRAGGLATQLHLLNGPLLNDPLAANDGRLSSLIGTKRTNEEIVTEFYERALHRSPHADERDYWLMQLKGDEHKRRERLEDFLWSLLTSREFTTNH